VGFRVLYLDADQHVAERVADALDADPVEFEVVTGRDPEAALNPLGTAEWGCLVTGYELPGMDGIEVLDAARAANPDLPVVLFVADGTEAVASRAITAGATDYVRPDADAEGVEHLVDRIRAAVEDATATPESGVNSDRAYREVFENVSDGVVVHDAETGEILDANRRYCETNGYSRDGEEFPVEVHLAVVWIGGRKRVLASVRDISERRQREQRLEVFNRVLRHDLRNQLDVITSHADSDYCNCLPVRPHAFVRLIPK